MKVRFGFVSNSSSSSFIVCGFNEDDSCEVYNILENKLKEEDPLTIGYIVRENHEMSDIGKTYIEEILKYKEPD